MSKRSFMLVAWVAFLLLLVACSRPDPETDPLAAGERIFSLRCASCHATGESTSLGPSVAEIGARRPADEAAAREWLRTGIVNPNAELAPGYSANLMPTTYAQILDPAEIDALVSYMLSLE